jgi:hypothetical protein
VKLTGVAKHAVTSDWPGHYQAQFWSDRALAYQIVLILFVGALIGSPITLVVSVGIVLAAVGAGVALGASLGFLPGWEILSAMPLLIVIVGFVSAVVAFPRRTNLYERYRPGTQTLITLSDGLLRLYANSVVVQIAISDVVALRRFGALSAIETDDGKYVVIPSTLVPHRPDATQPFNGGQRWRASVTY